MDPRPFNLMVQGPAATRRHECRGVVAAPVLLPARVEVAGHSAEASALTADLWTSLRRLGTGDVDCGGPCGLNCWASSSPVAQNLLVVVAGAGAPPSSLVKEVDQWLSQGFQVLGVVAHNLDPQVVLPRSMRSSVALRYHSSVTEVTDEIVDLVLLAGEERRAFISYSHDDGLMDAQAVFQSLARRRFNVYLDRFRTEPATDFVERIDDELRDKAMVVVIETPRSLASQWVLQEIMTAKFRGYGLLAINLHGRPKHPQISDDQRIELAAYDDEQICQAVERHHREAIVDQRHRRAADLRLALELSSRSVTPALTVSSEGDRCELLGGPADYSVLSAFRPAGVREARQIAEHGDRSARRPALYCPRPSRAQSRRDLDWLDQVTPVAIIPHGRMLDAARLMVRGKL